MRLTIVVVFAFEQAHDELLRAQDKLALADQASDPDAEEAIRHFAAGIASVASPTLSNPRREAALRDLVKVSSVSGIAGMIALLAVMLWVLASGGYRAFARFGLRFLTGRNW